MEKHDDLAVREHLPNLTRAMLHPFGNRCEKCVRVFNCDMNLTDPGSLSEETF